MSPRFVPALRLVAALALFLPALAFAEVSDKEYGIGTIWLVGFAAAAVCFVGGYFRRWLLIPLAVVPLVWFVGLFLELHSSDVGPALLHEQGIGYYVQAYLAGVVFLLGCALGWGGKRRKR
jgi:hypothetical protein